MRRLSPTGQRRLAGFSVLAVAAVAAFWFFFSDGLPILWGPYASASEIAEGQELFEHEWEPNDPLAHGDGLGPVFNAKACASCHFQGGLGGGGEVRHNATPFEVQPRPGDPTFKTGTVHNFSTAPAYKESFEQLKKLYPTVKGRTETITGGDPHCRYTTTVTVPDYDPVRTETVQTTALFGAGWIDLISEKAIRQNQLNRRMS